MNLGTNIMKHYKDQNNRPFYEPSEAVIAKYSLVPISEQEFDEIVVAINTPTPEQLAKNIRAQRNALLQQSDWTQVADAPVDTQAWATYRQALRDITEQAGFPDNVSWPDKPEDN